MAKKMVAFRPSEAGTAAVERLAACWGYASRSEALEAACCCWEWELAHAGEAVRARFARAEWNLMAECFGGLQPLTTGSDPAIALSTRLSDQHRLTGAGLRWLGGDGTARSRAEAEGKVSYLSKRLAALTAAEAHAVCCACRWAAARGAAVDLTRDEWWTPAFRRGKGAAPDPGTEMRRRNKAEELAAVLAEAGSIEALAEKLGVSVRAAWARCRRAGLVGPKEE